MGKMVTNFGQKRDFRRNFYKRKEKMKENLIRKKKTEKERTK